MTVCANMEHKCGIKPRSKRSWQLPCCNPLIYWTRVIRCNTVCQTSLWRKCKAGTFLRTNNVTQFAAVRPPYSGNVHDKASMNLWELAGARLSILLSTAVFTDWNVVQREVSSQEGRHNGCKTLCDYVRRKDKEECDRYNTVSWIT
jgi:hypothetical protein